MSRPLNRKEQMLDAVAAGQPIPGESKEVVLEELDKQSVQETILKPSSQAIKLIDVEELDANGNTKTIPGDTYYLPYNFSIQSLYYNDVRSTLKYFWLQMQQELRDLRGDRPLSANDLMFYGVMLKPSMRRATYELLAEVTGKPAATFQSRLDDEAVKAILEWFITVIQNTFKTGEPDPKK